MMSSKAFLPRKAAHSPIMDLFDHQAAGQYKIKGLKLLMLHRRSVLGHSSDGVATIFALQGGRYFDYGLMSLHSPWILPDTRSKFVDALLTLIIKTYQ